jgi:hypothetical protein
MLANNRANIKTVVAFYQDLEPPMGLEVKQFTVLLPKLIKKPKLLFTDKKALSNAIPLFSFLAPFGSLFFGPLFLFLTHKQQKTDKKQIKKSVLQEFFSQSILVTTHATSFILGGLLAGRMLPKMNPKMFYKGSEVLSDGQTLACLAGSFFGETFIRPFVTGKLLHEQEKKSDDNDKNKDQQDSQKQKPP